MKKRSLFAAVAMLIVSAVLLTSATYAWFTSNGNATIATYTANTATAEAGVKLRSTVSGSLWKGNLTQTDFSNGTFANPYNPATSVDGVNIVAYQLDDDLHFDKLDSATGVTSYEFQMGVTTAGKGISCTPKIEGTGAGAARVALLKKNGSSWTSMAIWSSDGAATNAIGHEATVPSTIVDDGNFILTADDSATPLASGVLVAQGVGSTPTILASETSWTTPTAFQYAYNDSNYTPDTYKVVIWLEGQDAGCKPADMSGKAITVSWTFAAATISTGG